MADLTKPLTRPFVCGVAGVTFNSGLAQIDHVGTPIRLVPEPENPFDSNAVRIEAYVTAWDVNDNELAHWVLVGHLPRAVAARVKGQSWLARIDQLLWHEHEAAGLRLQLRPRQESVV